jgi:pimeloyl-ACP methyl ester carboxylesterase
MTNLHYEDRGTGLAIIFLHGFPIDGRMWADQIPALSPKYRVIAPDLRGFGRSPPAGPFTIEDLADDVYSLSAKLKLHNFVLAGLSMGGYVSLAFAAKYAHLLRGLILLDTKSEADTDEGRKARDTMIETARTKGSAAIADAMQPKLLAAGTIANKPTIVNRFREMAEGNSPETLALALAAMRDRPDRTNVLRDIKVPTLIIVGDQDAVTPPSVAEAMHRAAAGSTLAIIRGAGHMTPMEQPEQVNAAIDTFLETVS